VSASGAVELSVLVCVPAGAPDWAPQHAELERRLAALGRAWEVLYLAVAGSASGGAHAARALAARDPERVRVLEFTHAIGESSMLRAGSSQARGPLLLTLPFASEVDLAALPQLLRALDAGADVAIACRKGPSAGAAYVQSRVFNRLISWAAGMRVRDVASATRAIRRPVFEAIPLYGEFHRYLPVLAQRLGFRVVEVDAPAHAGVHRRRLHGVTTYLWRALDVLSVLFICRFTRTPLRLFGGLGACFAVLGFVLLTVIGVQRLAGVPLGNRPMLVLAMLLIGLGVQAFTIGLLGELVLFVNARGLRDYRIASVVEGAAVPEVARLAEQAPRAKSDAQVLVR
jgi:hypothetical protein